MARVSCESVRTEEVRVITEARRALHRGDRRAAIFTGLTALALLALPRASLAQMQLNTGQQQMSFIDRQRGLARETEARMQENLPASQKIRVDYGGWYNNYFITFDDGIKSNRTLRQYEMRLWMSLNADRGIHEGYARMRVTYLDWNTGDNYTGNDDDLNGPNLERGWYQFDLTKALQLYEGFDSPLGVKFKIGRDLINTGTGYAISLPLDHVRLQTDLFNFETSMLYGRTPSSTPNIDTSRPVQDHSNRDFWIIEERYKGWDKHEPFVYIAWQEDHTREDPPNLLQSYKYDSRYVGWGSTGELIDNLKYGTEWVVERGSSYGNQRFLHANDIKAWAFDQRLDYYFRHKMKPVLSAEYMFASGEPTRLGSPTNAAGGVSHGYLDHSFVGFGYRDTGISYAPRLSNIHIWRVGGTFRPFPDVDVVRDMELGTDLYLFWKNRSVAAASDPVADEQSGYLGWEADHYVNYRIFSDLSFTVRVGTFFPGSAYSETSGRPFILTGITWSF